MYSLYLPHHTNGQMHSSIKIITKRNVFLCTNSNHPRWLYVEIYMHVIGLWLANTATAKIVIKHLGWQIGRLFLPCTNSCHELPNM